MTWVALCIGFVLGYLTTCIVLAFTEWQKDEEYILDSNEEYIDNTPTFKQGQEMNPINDMYDLIEENASGEQE